MSIGRRVLATDNAVDLAMLRAIYLCFREVIDIVQGRV